MSTRKRIISIFSQQTRLNIILAFVFIILSGCGYVPTKNISFITSSGDSLYFSMSNGKIRALDKHTLKWRDFTISDMNEPIIFNFFAINDGNIIIQAVDYGYKKPSVYLFNEQKGVKKYLNEERSAAMGIDSESVYFINTQSKKGYSSEGDWLISGFRYDKRFQTRKTNHFDDYPSLLVTDIWEDEKNFWYACIDNPPFGEMNALAGNNVLVARSKTTGALEKFELDTLEGDWNPHLVDDTRPLLVKGRNVKAGRSEMLWIRGDEDYIWLFSKRKNSLTYLIKFSKARKVIEYKQDLVAILVPFRGQNAGGDLWAVGEDYKTCYRGTCVYRIDKNNLKSTTIPMPGLYYLYNWNYHNTNILRPFNPFYEDENSLWVFVEQPRKVFTPSGCCVPYLMRISKKDTSYEMILVEPSIGEALNTILTNFFGWLFLPFMRGI